LEIKPLFKRKTLIKLFLDKQILIDKKIIKFIVYRSERSLTNLQKIVNRSIHQYLNDVIVREQVESYDKLFASGSKF